MNSTQTAGEQWAAVGLVVLVGLVIAFAVVVIA
jgi:hypothetical protein